LNQRRGLLTTTKVYHIFFPLAAGCAPNSAGEDHETHTV